MVLFIDIVLILMAGYLLGGLLFAFYFYFKAAVQIDEGYAGTPWHFKLIIFPGVILFWVILLQKVLKR